MAVVVQWMVYDWCYDVTNRVAAVEDEWSKVSKYIIKCDKNRWLYLMLCCSWDLHSLQSIYFYLMSLSVPSKQVCCHLLSVVFHALGLYVIYVSVLCVTPYLSIRLSRACLIWTKGSREPKINMKVALVTCNLHNSFEVKKSKVKVIRLYSAQSRNICAIILEGLMKFKFGGSIEPMKCLLPLKLWPWWYRNEYIIIIIIIFNLLLLFFYYFIIIFKNYYYYYYSKIKRQSHCLVPSLLINQKQNDIESSNLVHFVRSKCNFQYHFKVKSRWSRFLEAEAMKCATNDVSILGTNYIGLLITTYWELIQ